MTTRNAFGRYLLTGLAGLAFLTPSPAWVSAQEQTFVTDGQELKLFKGSSEPPSNWNSLDFDDFLWSDGRVPVGYGESSFTEPTWMVLNDMRSFYLTVYLRIPFEVPDPDAVSAMRLRAQYDDGFAAYLNGVEFARASVPAGDLTSTTGALDHEWTESAYNSPVDEVAMKALVVGTNFLAVEIHNANIDSSDMAFKPTLTATLMAGDGGDGGEPTEPEFIRGVECDGSPTLNIGDPVYLLRWQFGGFYVEPDCIKACDMDDNGVIEMADALFGLQYLFTSGPPFTEPYPAKGADPTTDELTCVSGEVTP